MIKIFKGRKGLAVLGIAASVILSVAILFAYLVAGRQTPKKSIYPRVQGLYESCSPSRGSLCLDRLKLIASAGFTLVVNYDQLYGDAEQQLAYANQAHSLGMKVIWGMSDPAFWN